MNIIQVMRLADKVFNKDTAPNDTTPKNNRKRLK
jgi:hypothetical protein